MALVPRLPLNLSCGRDGRRLRLGVATWDAPKEACGLGAADKQRRYRAMSSAKPKVIQLRTPQDFHLLWKNLSRTQDERLGAAMSVPMPKPCRLSREELIELGCRAVELLAPRFNAAEFHTLLQRLGAGPKFSSKAAERLLGQLCEEPVLELVRAVSGKRVAVYRVRKRRRSRQAPTR